MHEAPHGHPDPGPAADGPYPSASPWWSLTVSLAAGIPAGVATATYVPVIASDEVGAVAGESGG